MSALHVFEVGEGPDVVLLHGLPSPPEDLEHVARELHGYRVLVPHLPGYGRSAAAPGRQGIAAVSELLVNELRQRGIAEPALVGYSMGGYRALAVAATLRARAVVVLGGFAELSAVERSGMAGFAELLRANTNVRKLLAPRYLSAGYRAAHPEAEGIVESWLDAAAASVLIEELDDVANAPSLLAEIAKLACPVYARTGALDAAAPAEHAKTIAAASGGTFECVPDVGHALFVEDPRGTLAAIRRALAQSSATPRSG